MSDKIEMPLAVITDATVIFRGERKESRVEVRAELVVEVPSVSSADAPVAAVADLPFRPAGGGYSARPARRLAYRNRGGRLFAASTYELRGDDAHHPIDEAMLRRILAARPDDEVPHNNVVARSYGYSDRHGRRALMTYRHQMPTLAQIAEQKPIKEIVVDGMAAANRYAEHFGKAYAMVDGALHQRTAGLVYGLRQDRGSRWQVMVPLGLSGETLGAHLFDPRRLDDAEAMAARVGKRDRKGTAPRTDTIEIVDEKLFALDEPAVVMGHGMSHLWDKAGDLLHCLPADDLVRWSRLRDLETAVRRDGDRSRAVEAMAAFRDFVEGVRALKLSPHHAMRRNDYLRLVADPIHRIIETDLPRLGVRPGESFAAPDEDALADLGASPSP